MSKYFGKCFSPSTRAPKFSTQMLRFLFSKLCFIIKVSKICGAGRGYQESVSQVQFSGSCSQDSGFQDNMSQVPGTQFQGPGCHGPMPQGPRSRVLGVRVPCPRVPESQAPGPGSQRPGSQVLILDYAVPESRSCSFIK